MKNILQIFTILLIFFSTINNSFCAEEKTKRQDDLNKLYKYNAMGLVPISIIGFTQWDWGDPEFSSRSEGFFGKNTKFGGADKIGHFYSSYLVADLLSKKFIADGMERKKARIYGAGSAVFLTTIVELGDATSKDHGFSYEDQIMNTAGALTSYFLLQHPKLNEKIDLRIEYVPSRNPFGKNGKLLDDYEGMHYFANLKLSGFDFAKNNFWRFLELQTSYRTRGYVDNLSHKKREVSIGIGINIAQVIDYFTNNKTNKYVNGFFQYYQPPYTYINHNHSI